MATGHLQPPKAPSDQLRLESFQILSRLQLIFEFRVWLEYTRDNVPRRFDSPLVRLWDCMSFGAPLCTLLELLGSPTPRNLLVYPEEFNFDLPLEPRKAYIENFIQRTNALETQGRLSYGEVVRVDDFINGTLSGYTKVLRTVKRILVALQESYPGLFVVPHGSSARRTSLLQQLIGGERVHVSRLADVADAASRLYEQANHIMEPSLEAFIVSCSRLIPYHNLVLQSLSDVITTKEEERWDEVFSFTGKIFRTSIFTAYRSLCANYIPLSVFLESVIHKSPKQEEAHIILQHVSHILNRISQYHIVLQSILDVTTPATNPFYDALCLMTFEMYQLSETINEVGIELRTMWTCRRLPGRLKALKSLNMEGLGSVLLDDRLMIDPISGIHHSVFLFQTMLFCCIERQDPGNCLGKYPVKPWELGVALGQTTPLTLAYAIPIQSLRSLHCIDEAYFEVAWVDSMNTEQTVVFYPTMPMQYSQWVGKLEELVLRVFRSSSVPSYGEEDERESLHTGISLILTGDEKMYERRKSTARPWSLIGRKGNHSESSSFVGQEQDTASVLSSSLLPNLFNGNEKSPQDGARTRQSRSQASGNRVRKGHMRHRSAKSPLSSGFTRDDLMMDAHTPTPNNLSVPMPSAYLDKEDGRSPLADLTGKVFKEGHYPVAHGGHSDVWKANWKKADGLDAKVAVKVLRSTTKDAEKQAQLITRIHHELRVWKQLAHPHVLPLCGTVSDFGPFISMICPWMENGSVSTYLEKSGDILSVQDRLRIMGEVAEGLAYLHLCSIIHGDLTGSNVLLTSDLRAQLSDFGLSTIVMQSDAQTPDSFTSGLGGAVRWADSALFAGLHTAGDAGDEEWKPPPLTYKSDVYSLGSVMLEILSGRQPYHYIATDAQVVIELHKGNKPRRPAQSFVDDGQWELIQWCWSQPPEDRPDVHDIADRIADIIEERVDSRAMRGSFASDSTIEISIQSSNHSPP